MHKVANAPHSTKRIVSTCLSSDAGAFVVAMCTAVCVPPLLATFCAEDDRGAKPVAGVMDAHKKMATIRNRNCDIESILADTLITKTRVGPCVDWIFRRMERSRHGRLVEREERRVR